MSWGCGKEQGCWERALLCGRTVLGGADLDRAGTLHPAMLGDDSCEPTPRRDPLPGPLRVFCGGWLTMLQEGDFTALARELSSVSDRFAWGPPD